MLAEGLARAGMSVAILDIQQAAAQATADRLSRQTGSPCFAVPVDVSDRDALLQVAEDLQARPEPWGLVWINAGVVLARWSAAIRRLLNGAMASMCCHLDRRLFAAAFCHR